MIPSPFDKTFPTVDTDNLSQGFRDNWEQIEIAIDSKLNINGTVPMTGSLVLASDPTLALHAATKQYVDSIASGLDVKKSVRVATTGPGIITTSFINGSIIDGITLVTGDRILIKDQTNAIENGIYDIQLSGSPIRSADADNSPVGEVTSGMFTFVEEGTSSGFGWVLTTLNPIVISISLLNFNKFSSLTPILAGVNLSKTGNTIDLNPILTNFASTGIDDNATSTQIIITDALSTFNGRVNISNNQNNVLTVKQLASSLSNGAYALDVDSSLHTSNGLTAGALRIKTWAGDSFIVNGIGNSIFAGTISVTSSLFDSITTSGGLSVAKNIIVGGFIKGVSSVFSALTVNGEWGISGSAASGMNFISQGTTLAYEFRNSATTSIFSIDNNGTLDVHTNKIINLQDPTLAQDAATKAYVDNNFTSSSISFLPLVGGTITGDLSITSNLQIPSGTIIQRPTVPAIADIRFNTDLNSLEYYNLTRWQNIWDKDQAWLNYNPKVGLLNENIFPIYANFDFSSYVIGTKLGFMIDNKNNEVMFYSAVNGIGPKQLFRAFRFNDNSNFIFDNVPITTPDLNVGEIVNSIIGLSSTYIILVTDSSRHLLYNTNRSSRAIDWVLISDIISISSGSSWVIYDSSVGGGRIISVIGGSTIITYQVYDMLFNTIVASTVLFDATIPTWDNGTADIITAVYLNHVTNPAVTFDTKRKELIIRTTVIVYRQRPDLTTYYNYGLWITINNTFPDQHLLNNSIPTIRNIPLTNYNYGFLEQTTPVLGNGLDSRNFYHETLSYDDINDRLYLAINYNSADVSKFDRIKLNSSFIDFYSAIISGILEIDQLTITPPDISPIAKNIPRTNFNISGSSIFLWGQSNRFGTVPLTATISTTSFRTAINPNDTLNITAGSFNILDSTNYTASELSLVSISSHWTTYVNSSGTSKIKYSMDLATRELYTIIFDVNNLPRATPTGIFRPIVPANYTELNQYGYDPITNMFWTIATLSTDVGINANLYHILRKPLGLPWIDDGIIGDGTHGEPNIHNTSQTSSGTASIIQTSNGIVAQDGTCYVVVNYSVVGGRTSSEIFSISNTGIITYIGLSPTNWGSINNTMDWDINFGYIIGGNTSGLAGAATTFYSTRNVITGIDSGLFNPINRYFIPHESASGLISFTAEFPISVGGYVYNPIVSELSLVANSINYIYGLSNSVGLFEFFISDILFPDSHSRVLLSMITTDSASIINQVDYPISDGLMNIVDDVTPQLGGVLDALTNKIINLGTPTLAADAATKAYVDGILTNPVGLIEDFHRFMETPINKSYVLMLSASYNFNISQIKLQLGSGTLTAQLRVNNILAGPAHNVTSVALVNSTIINISSGQKVELVITASVAPIDFAFSIIRIRT